MWYEIYSELKKDPAFQMIEAEQLIEAWEKVYAGKPDWLAYTYTNLQDKVIKKCRKSMKPGKLVVQELASLIWAEDPEYNIDESVLQVFEDNNFFDVIQGKSERSFALGGLAGKLYVKDGKIKIDYIPASRFIPVSWDSINIYEADIIDRKVVNGEQLIRIEMHRKSYDDNGNYMGYLVSNRAFKLFKDKLSCIPLSQFDSDMEAEYLVQTDLPMFSYLKPPQENNFDQDSPLGISTYGNALDTIESLDIAFDALQSEILLGRKRIIVPASAVRRVYTDNDSPPEQYFDPSDEVFQKFDVEEEKDLKITDNSVEIRVEDIRRAIETLLDILSLQVGFSAGYLSFDGSSGIKTATEVISENSRTFKTKATYEKSIGTWIVDLANSIRSLGALYGIPQTTNEYSVVWNDSIIEDRNSRADYWIKLYTAGLVPLWKAVMKIELVDEVEAKKMAVDIKEDTATIDLTNIIGGEE